MGLQASQWMQKYVRRVRHLTALRVFGLETELADLAPPPNIGVGQRNVANRG